VSLLLAGRDDNGAQLYQIDPSGSYFAWKASAIGKNMVNAKTFLEKRCAACHTGSPPPSLILKAAISSIIAARQPA